MTAIEKTALREQIIHNAVEIISSEGLKAFSVRNLAERIGYSYPMLYKVFKDQKDLLFHVMLTYKKQIIESVTSKKISGNDIESIIQISQAYCEFFIQYPNIFQLLYLENTQGMFRNKVDKLNYYHILSELIENPWQNITANSAWTESEALARISQINYLIHGALLLHLENKIDRDYRNLTLDLGPAIRNILK